MERTVRRKFYPMAYYLKERDLGSGSRRFETQIHKTRDGLALAELSPLLYEGGYDYGATILNVPKRYLEKHNEEGVLLDTGHSLQRSDMILLVTRPPLNDKEDDHRAIFRGDNSIEEAVFKVLQGFLINCDRTEIIIHPNVDLGDREELRAVHFRVNQGGTAQYLDKQHMMIVPDDPQFTVGYLLGVPEIPGIGARLTVVFGMGGTETLWLCYLLRTRFPHEFHETISATKPRFRLITFPVPDYAPYPMLQAKPTDLKAGIVVCHMP